MLRSLVGSEMCIRDRFSMNTVLKRFSIQVPNPSLSPGTTGGHALVHFDDRPLQSVHIHLLVIPTVAAGGGASNNNTKMVLFNRFIIGMMRRAVSMKDGVRGEGGVDTPPHPYVSLLDIIDNTP
eukprot:TRINITY_DN13124_c0_g1_i1.p1 TRINITY_DN13124_c0_g1~~TRINITY_DN13124_c0_g1_i1.p1  ORF type:complete len:124 (+),score=22.75 TRINITY_DN13124_c0_g1_i1:127-498(+)